MNSFVYTDGSKGFKIVKSVLKTISLHNRAINFGRSTNDSSHNLIQKLTNWQSSYLMHRVYIDKLYIVRNKLRIHCVYINKLYIVHKIIMSENITR